MTRKWIIQITAKPDECVTARIGPFESEEEANRYCRIYLEPNFESSEFLLTDLEEPKQFIRDLLASIG